MKIIAKIFLILNIIIIFALLIGYENIKKPHIICIAFCGYPADRLTFALNMGVFYGKNLRNLQGYITN